MSWEDSITKKVRSKALRQELIAHIQDIMSQHDKPMSTVEVHEKLAPKFKRWMNTTSIGQYLRQAGATKLPGRSPYKYTLDKVEKGWTKLLKNKEEERRKRIADKTPPTKSTGIQRGAAKITPEMEQAIHEVVESEHREKDQSMDRLRERADNKKEKPEPPTTNIPDEYRRDRMAS